MVDTKVSFSFGVEGSIAGLQTHLYIGKVKGAFVYAGEINLKDAKLSDTLMIVDEEFAKQYGMYVNSLTSILPESVSFTQNAGITSVTVDMDALYFVVRRIDSSSTALLITFDTSRAKDSDNIIVQIASKIGGILGIENFIFFARTGNTITYSQMLKSQDSGCEEVPSKLDKYQIIIAGRFAFNSENILGLAMNELFGMHDLRLSLFLGIEDTNFLGMVMFPSIEQKVLSAKDLYLGIEKENEQIGMCLSGTFEFSFLKGVTFVIGCKVSINQFSIEANARIETPISLIGNIKLGDTCLAVGYNQGFAFNMYSNLYLGNISLFGAIGLAVIGEVVNLNFISAAVSDLTIPILVQNLLGLTIPGIEAIDFIRLLGLPFQEMKVMETGDAIDKKLLVGKFNQTINDNSLNLEENKIKLTPITLSLADKGDVQGWSLVDQKRMRHYFVDNQGNVRLLAQFYYSVVDMILGDYDITRGIFLCGMIEIFKYKIKTLFSFREGEGVLAFAYIQNIDLGFFKIGASRFENQPGTLQLKDNNVLRQFVGQDEVNSGAIFYLNVSKSSVSFYIDGAIHLIDLLDFDTRIIFQNSQVEINTQFDLAIGISTYFMLRANYSDFQSARFSFLLTIDCTKLKEIMDSIQRKINEAIEAFQQKMSQARNKLIEAQNSVNQLYGQINYFDDKIRACKEDIRHASWWKKAFVAVAKGIEIGAYEVAKVGIYTAIGIATAALELAKQAVNLGEAVGTGVLQVMNGLITVATNLFFIQSVSIGVDVSGQQQKFSASITFVLMGETHSLSKEISRGEIKNPNNMIQGAVSPEVDNKVKSLENATGTRSNRNRYKTEDFTILQHSQRLEQAIQHITSSSNTLKRMEEEYTQTFKKTIPEFEQVNLSYQSKLSEIENVLHMANKVTDVDGLEPAVNRIEDEIDKQEKASVTRSQSLNDARKAVEDFKKVQDLLGQVNHAIEFISGERQTMDEFHKKQVEQAQLHHADYVTTNEPIVVNEEEFLNKTEGIIFEEFPVSRSTRTFINLSRETVIGKHFDEARVESGSTASSVIRSNRTRAANLAYEKRLS